MEGYACPKCGSDNLEVSVVTWATLIQTADGIETDTTTVRDGSHEWDGASHMLCRDCQHTGRAMDFDREEHREIREDAPIGAPARDAKTVADMADFVAMVARMRVDGEVDDDGAAYHQDVDDACETMDDLIVTARELVNRKDARATTIKA